MIPGKMKQPVAFLIVFALSVSDAFEQDLPIKVRNMHTVAIAFQYGCVRVLIQCLALSIFLL